ncbi:(S)-2-hydroxy-acid oxidase [Legionella quinlivanii DSM 21216]|uniref:alpha-hydroxy acid oxidase n=1 Tax=Legionella quinlivanii TaxID=45073 RepID=UPI00089E8FA8|nr:alpha-hydroxy acid oxidase [Legionella quinlivanii]SEG40526.1 (S)-2-hydroxy-acid oxidase [Legionella quinlivanii DSM 21216]
MLTVWDYREAALAKIPQPLSDYLEKSAGMGKTFRGNFEAFSNYKLIPRVLQNINHVETSTFVLGENINSPIIIAPTAWHKLYSQYGEKDTCNAAKLFGVPYIISSFSTCDFHEIGSDLSHAWYQLLVYKDKELMQAFIKKAENAGCSAIVLTIDAPLGCTMCKVSNQNETFEFPIQQMPLFPKDENIPYSSLDDYYEKYINSSASWDDIEEIISLTNLPIILKGILHPMDAKKAAEIGIKGIIISNHGGRQLDDAISSLDALQLLPQELKNQIDIYIDGGIRSGIDIFKAMALGAKAILIGRPVLYGLITGGQQGVVSLLQILNKELRDCMHMAGCSTISNITKDLLYSVMTVQKDRLSI